MVLLEIIPLSHLPWKRYQSCGSDLLTNGVWSPNPDTQAILTLAGIDLRNIFVKGTGGDTCLYKPDLHGTFSVKETHGNLRSKLSVCWWKKYIWRDSCYPRPSNLTWRIILNVVPTDQTIHSRSIQLVSQCRLCKSAVESTNHLFLVCPISQQLWRWLSTLFGLKIDN
ncbi:hypothetical protein GIB67_039145 [Kingdonia uniflora]|uniref:Reverse transcriptase zinc-binding domain-containing protein n=1 Tax=Kingdonia uniflora TaxID=39325 RepID=A0A7J7MLX7_9MAGN|nr:hypothetical protein GIB67_039145 [Kingdonia uniflora]